MDTELNQEILSTVDGGNEPPKIKKDGNDITQAFVGLPLGLKIRVH